MAKAQVGSSFMERFTDTLTRYQQYLQQKQQMALQGQQAQQQNTLFQQGQQDRTAQAGMLGAGVPVLQQPPMQGPGMTGAPMPPGNTPQDASRAMFTQNPQAFIQTFGPGGMGSMTPPNPLEVSKNSDLVSPEGNLIYSGQGTTPTPFMTVVTDKDGNATLVTADKGGNPTAKKINLGQIGKGDKPTKPTIKSVKDPADGKNYYYSVDENNAATPLLGPDGNRLEAPPTGKAGNEPTWGGTTNPHPVTETKPQKYFDNLKDNGAPDTPANYEYWKSQQKK
jgi:hypothetical protein